MNLARALAPLACALALFAAPARAQCPTPDGLDIPGSACSPAFTAVPQRGFKQPCLGICWQDCSVNAVASYTASFANMTPILGGGGVSCAWYIARTKIFNGSQLVWDGQMHFTYSRTWMEADPSGLTYQVWRFLMNGDMQPIVTGFPCGTPPCSAPNGNKVRFTGYIDYAQECGSGVVSQAWMLTHACDSIDHVPGFPRAGVFHPNRHYTFVGPAAGFAIGAGATIEAAPMPLESLRKWDALVLPARCNAEEPLMTPTAIVPNAMVCMCGVGPANWFEGTLFAAGTFGTTVNPFPGSAPFRSFPIGRWTIPGVFPGVEELRWNCNEANWIECTGLNRFEFYFGVTTVGGWTAFSLNAGTPPFILPIGFIDQSNSVNLPGGIATRNRKYRSDHILNLNF